MSLLYKEDINDIRKTSGKKSTKYPNLYLTVYRKNLDSIEHLQGTLRTNFVSI